MSQPEEIKVEWTARTLTLHEGPLPNPMDAYIKAMEGKVCTVCGEGFPRRTPGWLMGFYYEAMLDRHVEWGTPEAQELYGYVHTNCHDFKAEPAGNYQFIPQEGPSAPVPGGDNGPE